ncbi:hypothetical protein, partial [Legionella londiniensis]
FNSANVIDTAPRARILVMAQSAHDMGRKGTGIIVYRFDEKTQTLTRLWAPDGPPRHRLIKNPDDLWEA